MKRWKVLVSLCLSFSMWSSSVAYASVVVPPVTSEAGNTAQQGQAAGQSGNQSSASKGGETENAGPGGAIGKPSAKQDSSSNTVTSTKLGAQPQIASEGVALMDCSTGKLLLGKNADKSFYPASVTKLMTALLILENCNLDDTVTFSKSATMNLELGSVTLNLTEGDTLTVRQSLYALLLKSANEVANGLAEHMSGSVDAFVAKMNEKAQALGCVNTHFANPNGLNSDQHYTTPFDMALIAREAYKNETLCEISSTLSYVMPATKKSPQGVTITMGHKMLNPQNAQYYQGIVGGKTGYTSLAGNTLVTCAERDGVRLVAVVMKAKTPAHYSDTKAMLDYGFENYEALTTGVNLWRQDANGWQFTKADGALAGNEWMIIDGNYYWFDSNNYMATGWRQFSNGAWYYFRSSGIMATNYWAPNNGKWFYLGEDGTMMKDTTTPDGYKLGEDGAWVE